MRSSVSIYLSQLEAFGVLDDAFVGTICLAQVDLVADDDDRYLLVVRVVDHVQPLFDALERGRVRAIVHEDHTVGTSKVRLGNRAKSLLTAPGFRMSIRFHNINIFELRN